MRAAFWIGLTALADHDRHPRFRDAILAMGKANDWKADDRPYHADSQAILQAYLWAARNGAGSAARAPAQGQVRLYPRASAARDAGLLPAALRL